MRERCSQRRRLAKRAMSRPARHVGYATSHLLPLHPERLDEADEQGPSASLARSWLPAAYSEYASVAASSPPSIRTSDGKRRLTAPPWPRPKEGHPWDSS